MYCHFQEENVCFHKIGIMDESKSSGTNAVPPIWPYITSNDLAWPLSFRSRQYARGSRRVFTLRRLDHPMRTTPVTLALAWYSIVAKSGPCELPSRWPHARYRSRSALPRVSPASRVFQLRLGSRSSSSSNSSRVRIGSLSDVTRASYRRDGDEKEPTCIANLGILLATLHAHFGACNCDPVAELIRYLRKDPFPVAGKSRQHHRFWRDGTYFLKKLTFCYRDGGSLPPPSHHFRYTT